MKKFLINVLCAFVPGKQRRKQIRARLKHPITQKMLLWVKTFSDQKKPNVKCTFGFRCANFVVTLDNKWVFKFPLHGDAKEIAFREKRITDALRPVSTIQIPNMDIIMWNDIYVRKYEFIPGINFHKLSHKSQQEHAQKLAAQLALCLYTIANADPQEIADLKPRKTEEPSLMRGWNQNDLWDNFIINPETFDIVGLIDWESAEFTDFYTCFLCGTSCDIIRLFLLREYLQLARKKA